MIKSDYMADTNYTQNYSEENFWTKLKCYALLAGRKVVRPSLHLYVKLTGYSGRSVALPAAEPERYVL